MSDKNLPAGGKENRSDTCRTQIDQAALSHAGKQRLKWMNHFIKYRNARLTCRHFGISPDTFYLWKRRFSPDNLKTLEDDLSTRRPRKLRSSEGKAKKNKNTVDIRVKRNVN
jgi:hypothetical protein